MALTTISWRFCVAGVGHAGQTLSADTTREVPGLRGGLCGRWRPGNSMALLCPQIAVCCRYICLTQPSSDLRKVLFAGVHGWH
jgi:hypothetical protein